MIYGLCSTCKKKRFFVKKRGFSIPSVNEPLLSKKEICRNCHVKVLKALKLKKYD